MYTFLILITFFFLVSGILYKGKIKQHLMGTLMIVVAGTFVGNVIVNGIHGMGVPYTKIIVDSDKLTSSSTVLHTDDSTYKFESYVRYFHIMNEDDSTKVDENYLRINDHIESFYQSESYKLIITFLPEGDTVPYYNKYRQKRMIDDKWISSVAMPRGKTTWELFIPNDLEHREVLKYMNQNFFNNEESEEEITKLN